MDLFYRGYDPNARISSAAKHLSAAAMRFAVSIVRSIPNLPDAAWADFQRLLTVEALWSSGLMQFMNPHCAGGHEPSFRELIDTWQELAWQDGSVGWIGIANFPGAAFAAAYLPEAGYDEVFVQHGNRSTVGGQFAPNGLGQRVEGGYRLSGSWNFGSGTGHSNFVVGGFIPMHGGEMQMGELGMPEMLVAVRARAQVKFTEGWFVQGLKATGSYDYNV